MLRPPAFAISAIKATAAMGAAPTVRTPITPRPWCRCRRPSNRGSCRDWLSRTPALQAARKLSRAPDLRSPRWLEHVSGREVGRCGNLVIICQKVTADLFAQSHMDRVCRGHVVPILAGNRAQGGGRCSAETTRRSNDARRWALDAQGESLERSRHRNPGGPTRSLRLRHLRRSSGNRMPQQG